MSYCSVRDTLFDRWRYPLELVRSSCGLMMTGANVQARPNFIGLWIVSWAQTHAHDPTICGAKELGYIFLDLTIIGQRSNCPLLALVRILYASSAARTQ